MNTVEMIQKIKEGQKAKAIGWDIKVKMDKGDIIVLSNGSSSQFVGKPLPLSGSVLGMDWKLKPQPISFKEAIDLLQIKNEVFLYTQHDNTLLTISSFKDMISIEDFYCGVWYNALDIESIDDLE